MATGLVIKAKAAKGLQCEDTDDAVATITIQEGFKRQGSSREQNSWMRFQLDGDTPLNH